MEFIPGGTLAEYLADRKQVAWENVVDYAIQMCSALQHAHEHGVIHRDVKPGNFLLTKSGHLKLSDFGLESVVSEGRLTASGPHSGHNSLYGPRTNPRSRSDSSRRPLCTRMRAVRDAERGHSFLGHERGGSASAAFEGSDPACVSSSPGLLRWNWTN